MSEVVKRRIQQQRRAVLGHRAEEAEARPAEPTIQERVRSSFAEHVAEHREQQEQVEQTRRERAMQIWKEVNESEEQ